MDMQITKVHSKYEIDPWVTNRRRRCERSPGSSICGNESIESREELLLRVEPSLPGLDDCSDSFSWSVSIGIDSCSLRRRRLRRLAWTLRIGSAHTSGAATAQRHSLSLSSADRVFGVQSLSQ